MKNCDCRHPVQFVRWQEVLRTFDKGAGREGTTTGGLSIISPASLLEAKIVSKEPTYGSVDATYVENVCCVSTVSRGI